MKIEVCLTEEEIGRDFFRSLRRSELEEKFFYWFPLSVLAWLRLCQSNKYRNYARSLALAQRASREFPRKIPAKKIQWVSLGCGQGTKEIPFLLALRRARKRVRYFPLDFSQPLLERAVTRALTRGIPTLGFKADFGNREHLEKIPKAGRNEIRVVSLFGNTLGNLQSSPSVQHLARWLRRGDLLIVDGELFAGSKTFAEYDHPTNRRFALAPLASIGIRETDGNLRFELEKTKEDGLYRLTKSFQFAQVKKVSYSGRTLSFRKGETLQMSPSYKYDSEGMKRMLEEMGEFKVCEFWESADHRFGVWVAEKTQ